MLYKVVSPLDRGHNNSKFIVVMHYRVRHLKAEP